jgi:single-strand DNA-binding protein
MTKTTGRRRAGPGAGSGAGTEPAGRTATVPTPTGRASTGRAKTGKAATGKAATGRAATGTAVVKGASGTATGNPWPGESTTASGGRQTRRGLPATAREGGPHDAAELAVGAMQLDLAVVAGVVRGTPERRQLASGSDVIVFDVAVALPSGRVIVPVTWADPPTRSPAEAGAAVLVVGVVHRRFFRAGGTTQSRTEVVASAVHAASSRAKVRRALARAATELAKAADSRGR